mmetsp:Transcript_77221/g.214732  ORF Transcript_77221/g.214732 Transcript_77221/m.214732 type:complete len:207 (+) Transcript_77221:877-1497(+)
MRRGGPRRKSRSRDPLQACFLTRWSRGPHSFVPRGQSARICRGDRGRIDLRVEIAGRGGVARGLQVSTAGHTRRWVAGAGTRPRALKGRPMGRGDVQALGRQAAVDGLAHGFPRAPRRRGERTRIRQNCHWQWFARGSSRRGWQRAAAFRRGSSVVRLRGVGTDIGWNSRTNHRNVAVLAPPPRPRSVPSRGQQPRRACRAAHDML